jgi:ABC-type sugar transport system permease subunit
VRPGEFPFVGLENYLKISRSRVFWAAVGRTFYFTGVSVGVAIILGLGIALVLNQDFKGRAFVRGLIILPWTLSSVVNGMMWKWIYDGSYGALNGFLLQLGWIDSYKVWLADPRVAMNFVVMAEIWKETPVGVIFILAFLQTIPSSLYEAAKVDGASPWRRFRYITLPLLKPIILLLIVLKSVWAIRDSFDIVYMITRGGPAESTQVVTFYAYLTTFKFLRFGYGAAISYLITLIILVFAVVYMRLVYTETLYAETI